MMIRKRRLSSKYAIMIQLQSQTVVLFTPRTVKQPCRKSVTSAIIVSFSVGQRR